MPRTARRRGAKSPFVLAKSLFFFMFAGYAPLALVATLACTPPAAPPPVPIPRTPPTPAAPPSAPAPKPPPPGLDAWVTSPFAEASAPEDLQLGQAHRVAGRLGLARVYFERFLQAHRGHPLAPAAALVLGDLLHRGGDPAAAAQWFAWAADALPAPLDVGDPPVEITFDLKDFARMRAARSAAAAGQWAAAERWSAQVTPGTWYGRAAQSTRVDALRALGQAGAAADLLEAVPPCAPPTDGPPASGLASRSLPPACPEPAPDFAVGAADLQLVDLRLAAGQVARAIATLRRVAVAQVDAAGARRVAQRLNALRWKVPAATWQALTQAQPLDVLVRGRALLDAHMGDALEAEVLACLRAAVATPGEAAWCEAWWLLARARTQQRHHAEAAAAYNRVAEDCPDDDRAPEARYAEARAWYTADHHDHALAAVEAFGDHYPTHRLAGDVLALAARIHRDLGEPDAARDQLQRLLHEHPEDDMAVEALWGLFQDDPAQVADVDPATVEREPDQRGRLAYFRGVQADARGDAPAAARAWQAAVRQAPMSYYALLALNRLRERQPTQFEAILADLAAHPPPAPPLAMFLGDPGREEGLHLLRLGFSTDAWRAFTDAGPGTFERARYRAAVAHVLALGGAEASARRVLAREVTELDDAFPLGDERDRFEATYPHEFVDLILQETVTRDLPPALLFGLVRTESRFDPQARSWAGACGLVQLLPATARGLARADGLPGAITCRRLMQPAVALRLGARYLADLRDRFGAHPGVQIAGYHAGPGNLARFLALPERDFAAWVEALPFGATRLYIKRVLQAWWVYTWLGAEPGTPLADRVPVVPRERPI